MKARKHTAVVAALVICAGLVFASIALASAAKTKVSIEAEQGGFFGFVHTKRSASEECENGRKVVLYKQKGSEQKPHRDKKIGSDIAQPNGPDSQWQVSTDKSGKFYAKAPAKNGCKAGYSDTVHSE